MANTNWLTEFPELERPSLVAMRKFLDGAYRDFSRTYGDAIEQVFDPLLYFLVWFEKLLLAAPWPIVLLFLVGVTHVAARSFKLTAGVTVSFLLIGYFGMWDNTMRTLSIITVATLLSIAVGIPIGIMMARSDRVRVIFGLTEPSLKTQRGGWGWPSVTEKAASRISAVNYWNANG